MKLSIVHRSKELSSFDFREKFGGVTIEDRFSRFDWVVDVPSETVDDFTDFCEENDIEWTML